MRKLIFIYFLICGSFVAQTFAQKYSNEFLSIGVGARAHGMGNSVVATTNDVYSGYWNPAGLMGLLNTNAIQLGVMHAEWFTGIANYDYIGLAIPKRSTNRVFGLSVIRMGIDNIPNTLSLFDENGAINYDRIVPFSASDYGILGNYAQAVKIRNRTLHIGGNVKVVRRVIGQFANSWGFGIDLGAQYKSGNWQWGLMARDITTTFNAWRFNFTDNQKAVLGITGNDIPINAIEVTRPYFILGSAYSRRFKQFGALAEVNLNINTDGQRNTLISSQAVNISPSVGIELDYKQKIFARTGVNQFQYIKEFGDKETLIYQPNFGVGLKIFKLRIDYAYSDLGLIKNAAYSHIISATLDINTKYVKQAIKEADSTSF